MKTRLITLLLFAFFSIATNNLYAQTANKKITIENYYKVKWGYAEEFIALWKKNHYPLRKNLQEKGDVLAIHAETPLLHSNEESRWDFKVALTFKNENLAFDYGITAPYKKQLYPDEDAYKKAEQHHFKLLLAHWDIPVEEGPLN